MEIKSCTSRQEESTPYLYITSPENSYSTEIDANCLITWSTIRLQPGVGNQHHDQEVTLSPTFSFLLLLVARYSSPQMEGRDPLSPDASSSNEPGNGTGQVFPFMKLPPELRLQIYETVALERPPFRGTTVFEPGLYCEEDVVSGFMSNRRGLTRSRPISALDYTRVDGVTCLACVCREWQVVFEKKNFRKLKIRCECLDEFEAMVAGKQAYIKHIWLNVMPPREHIGGQSEMMGEAITKLFSILSTWRSHDDLTLELNLIEPYDRVWFPGLYYSTDIVDRKKTEEEEKEEVDARVDPGNAGPIPWIIGPDMFSATTIMGLEGVLQEVRAVTRLVIRRQLRRCFTPFSLALIIGKLTGLEHIIYEPWRECHGAYQARSMEPGGKCATLSSMSSPQPLTLLVGCLRVTAG